MQPWFWIVLAIVIIVVVVVLVVLAGRRNARRNALRERFGPEYDLALRRGKDRRAVEQRLEELARRRDTLDIHEVAPEEHVRFARDWDRSQARFVDDPGQSVADADGLVNSVLRSRGYPVESFDDRAALLATDHQDVVEGYRRAHDTFAGHLQGGSGDTEQLRQAFLQYREVFERLNMPRETPGGAARDQTDQTDQTGWTAGRPAEVEAPTAPPALPPAAEEHRPPVMSPAAEPAPAQRAPEFPGETAIENADEQPAATRLDATALDATASDTDVAARERGVHGADRP